MDKFHLRVHIVYRDEKSETFSCTDFPGIGNGWITLYKDMDRIMIPDQAIKRIDYGVAKAHNRDGPSRKIGFRPKPSGRRVSAR